MTQAVVTTPNPWEMAYWISQIALTVIVLVTAIFAWLQLRMLARQSRATMLLDLDRRWESAEFTKARSVVVRTWDEVIKGTSRQKKSEVIDDTGEKFKEFFADHLDKMQIDSIDSYEQFKNVWGFFETLGYLYIYDYLSAGEIDKLFGYSIIQVDNASGIHIKRRNDLEKQKAGFDPDLYTNSLLLARHIRQVQQTQTMGRPRSMILSFSRWLECKAIQK